MIKLEPGAFSSASSSSDSHKRAGSSDSDDDSFISKKSRSCSMIMEEGGSGELEPYVRRRRTSNEKAKNRILKMDPEEQDRLRQCINSRERKRMHSLNFALDQLRTSLPYSKSPASKKLSKINTIVSASEWICRLTDENDRLRKKLSEHGTSIPAILFQPSTIQHHHQLSSSSPPPPPFISSSSSSKPKRSEIKMNAAAASKKIPKAAPPPPPPPPPLDPAPQMTAAAFLSNLPPFFSNFFQPHQAAAAAAAVANFGLPSRLPMPIMPSPQFSNFCLKECGNGNGVCLCIKCILSTKNNNTVS